MSEHDATTVKPADNPAFQLPAPLAALSLPLCIGGLAALVIGWAVGLTVNASFAMSAYLTAIVYCVTLAVGCLFFVLIQHLCRAGWSVVLRRIAELVMIMIVPLAILFIPVIASLLFGEGTLYRWDDPTYAVEHGLPMAAWAEKTRWLTPGWFTIRAIIYFAIWSALALYYYRGSVEQDQTGDKSVTDRLQYWSGPAVMLFCGATSFAAFDWVMSLAPMWFSTMFGVYLFAGSVLAAHCVLAVSAYVLQEQGALRDEVTVEHYHDLGKYMFGFVFFWTYISFSQYLLIWYGNIPEETVWFYHRQTGSWGTLGLILIFFHWMLPFLGLLSRHVRRNPTLVFGWAVYLLLMHFIDIYWMIMPESIPVEGVGHATMGGVRGVISSLLCVGGMLSLLTGLVLRVAQQTKVVAVQDPRLRESIAFENI